MFIVFIGCNLLNTQHGDRWQAATMRTGPNDAKHVVWAIGEFFFFLFGFFLY
jgi:hypothetical protein